MTDAGFYRGTSTDQDLRFTDKHRKLLKTMRFAPCLESKVAVSKVNLDVIKPWITKRINEILGVEDDVVIEYVFSQLEEKSLEPKIMQINLTGFLNAKRAREFMGELWQLMIDANGTTDGIPPSLIAMKMKQLQKKAETENFRSYRRENARPAGDGLDAITSKRAGTPPPRLSTTGGDRNNDSKSDWQDRFKALTGGRYGRGGDKDATNGRDRRSGLSGADQQQPSEAELVERQKAREQRHKEQQQRERGDRRPRDTSGRRHHSPPPPATRRRFTEEKGGTKDRRDSNRDKRDKSPDPKRRRFTEGSSAGGGGGSAPSTAEKASPPTSAEKRQLHRRKPTADSSDESDDDKLQFGPAIANRSATDKEKETKKPEVKKRSPSVEKKKQSRRRSSSESGSSSDDSRKRSRKNKKKHKKERKHNKKEKKQPKKRKSSSEASSDSLLLEGIPASRQHLANTIAINRQKEKKLPLLQSRRKGSIGTTPPRNP